MCSIAAIFSGAGSVEPSHLDAMHGSMRHRGPDDEGYFLANQKSGQSAAFAGKESAKKIRQEIPTWGAQLPFEASVGLAHGRFSILDFSARAHQPFLDQGGRCSVIHNGEIYNYLELREDLKSKGHVFESNSDGEVIAEAYKEWGTECFSRFNGMWALLIYDFEKRMLLASRDRLGKKPLYWTRMDGVIYLASEIKALLAVPAIRRSVEVNEAAIYPYLAYGIRDFSNATFFEGIEKFQPGSWSLIDENFPNKIQRYWRPPEKRLSENEMSIPEAAAQLRSTLSDAVSIRLRTDTPWCTSLSGGLDSSIISALAGGAAGPKVPSYHLRGNGYSLEEGLSKNVAAHCKTELRIVDVQSEDFWADAESFVSEQEEPFHSQNLHAYQRLLKSARGDGFKVCLNGAGGDELFGGYPEYFPHAQYENLARGRMVVWLQNTLHWTEGSKGKALLLPCEALAKRVLRNLLGAFGWQFHPYIHAPSHQPPPILNSLGKTIERDLASSKMPYWLTSGDKSQMSIPMEVRMPFLDHRVMELALKLPTSYLIRNGWHKWILRKAFEAHLPHEIVWRRNKAGGCVTAKPAFDFEKISEGAGKHASGTKFVDVPRHASENLQWRIMSFLMWHESFFGTNSKALFHRVRGESAS